MLQCYGLDMFLKTYWEHTDFPPIAEQHLHSIEAVSVSHSAPLVKSLKGLKKLGGDTAETADPNWSKKYFILYSVILQWKAGEGEEREAFRVVMFVVPSNYYMW